MQESRNRGFCVFGRFCRKTGRAAVLQPTELFLSGLHQKHTICGHDVYGLWYRQIGGSSIEHRERIEKS
ncbi:hypothetical protein JT27_09100 [Alcaligenes faecalis]|nr:hypothetical protein JT27_09100 [Alcaligenes faecalis]